jgi:hypothetical protein
MNFFNSFCLFACLFVAVLEIKPRTLFMLGKYSRATPQALRFFCVCAKLFPRLL